MARSSSTANEAQALARKAEASIAEGDLEGGVPMLLSALDAAPGLVDAIEALGVVTQEEERFRDELFARLRRAVERAPSDEALAEALWLEVTYAAFHDRRSLVESIARRPEPLLSRGAAMVASLGALLVELRDVEAGMAQLSRSDSALSRFHRARLALGQGREDEAKALLAAIGTRGVDGLLREIGEAKIGLESPDGGDPREAVRRARSLVAKAKSWEDPLGPHVASEVLLLELDAALAATRPRDAAWAGEQLGMPPHAHDPGAMLRAHAKLGPLHLLRD